MNGIHIISSHNPVESCQLFVDASFSLKLFRGHEDSTTLLDDFFMEILNYVGNDMYNEYVDVDHPLYRLVIKNDTNSINWESFNGSENMSFREFMVYKDSNKTNQIGTLALFFGGLYKENPYQWMNYCTDLYINKMLTKKTKHILNSVDSNMDNPWIRVILALNDIDSLFNKQI